MDAPEGNGQQKDEDSLHHKGVCTAKRLFLGNFSNTWDHHGRNHRHACGDARCDNARSEGQRLLENKSYEERLRQLGLFSLEAQGRPYGSLQLPQRRLWWAGSQSLL